MATKPKASPKKAAPTKAASKPAAKPTAKAARPKITNKDIEKAVTSVERKALKEKLQKMSKDNPTYKVGTQGATKAPYSPSYKGPTRTATPTPTPAASTSMATKMGAAYGGLKRGAIKAGSRLIGGATGSKAKKIGGRAAIGVAAIGAGNALYNAMRSSNKTASKPASKAPVQSDLAKKYNRRDEIGKPATPMVLKKPTAPTTTTTVAKKSIKKAAPKRPGQVALAKGITAKDIKPSTPATIGKPEVKSVTLAKAPTTSATSESKPKYSEKRIERMENRAERKSERMENRAERLEKRAGKLKSKLKYGGSMKAKNGKSFPDLNKDGKITKADILKGRGVIAKKGAAVKKCKYGCN